MDYTTLYNAFEGFDTDYQLYILNVILEYMLAAGKNDITRLDIYRMIHALEQKKDTTPQLIKAM